MRQQSDEVPRDPHEAAIYWVAIRRLRSISPNREPAFQAWLDDPRNAAAYAEVDEPLEAAGELAGHPEILQLRNAALVAAPIRSRKPAWRGLGLGLVAACAVAAVGLGAHGLLWEPATPAGGAVATKIQTPGHSSVKQYATRVGERLNVTLEDGSVLSLNTDSLLEVTFTPRRRDIRLLRGQAMFQVAKNKVRPFVVTAGDRQITATGTAFEVRLDGPRVKVLLVEGHVLVTPIERNVLERLAPALVEQELSPGEELTSLPAARVSVEPADIDRSTSWRRGQLIFRDDSLASAVAEFNRYTTTQMVVDDPELADLKISGVFGSARSENFIAAITAYYPVKAEVRTPGTVVLTRRGGPEIADR